jgi:peptide/nickel transport system permease protein
MLIPALIVIGLTVSAPLIVPFDPERGAGSASLSPNGENWFGTDSAGMDVFSRTIAAFRIDIPIALATTVFATVIGITLGLVIGMSESARGPRAWVGRGLARLIDLMESIPAVVLGLVVVAMFGANATTLIAFMSVVLCSGQTRLTRTEVLRIRREAYVDAARMAGESELSLTMRHVLPNAAWPALQNSSVIFAISIILTAGLGFIGAGMPPPTPEWGGMISRGASDALAGRWWSAAFPAAALAITVASFSAAANAVFGRPRT